MGRAEPEQAGEETLRRCPLPRPTLIWKCELPEPTSPAAVMSAGRPAGESSTRAPGPGEPVPVQRIGWVKFL